jgi:TolA-binding protein
MKTISMLVALVLLSGVCLAQPVPSDGEAAAAPHHKKSAKAGKKASASAEDIKQLKEQIQAQQAQIDQLKQQQALRDQQAQQTQQGVSDAQKAAADAQAKAAAAQSAAADTSTKVDTVQSDVSGLKTTVDNTVVTVQKDTKRVDQLEEPAFIHYKGVKLTPGGYAQFATIYRAHNANMDTADNYGQYAYANSPNYYQSEFRATGRASRLSLKVEGEWKSMKFMDYTEIDFLASAGGNETQTNSFSPRLRLAFANVDLPGGWSIAGGQNWTLLQTTRKGIDPLTEWLPSVIDNSYVPGFSYAREGSLRVVKQVTPKAWFGFAVENPDTVTTGGCTPSGNCASGTGFTGGQIQGLANSQNTATPNNGYLNALSGTGAITGNPSTNVYPDLVAKIAFEPGWGHFEVKAIGRWFRDRIYPNYLSGQTTVTTTVTGTQTVGGVTTTVPVTTTTTTFSDSTVGAFNATTHGGGIGFGAVVPVIKNKVDFAFQGLAGAGIGRFSTTSGPDVTYKPSGALVPVKGVQMVAAIETHPTPKFDFNLYAGGDYYRRITYFVPKGSNFFGATTTGAAEVGYGYQENNDTGCSVEGSLTTTNGVTSLNSECSGVTKDVLSGTAQLWYRIYKGRAGSVQFGTSYAYVYREGWAGRGPNASPSNVSGVAAPSGLVSPKTINQVVMTSFRYYIP